MAHPRRLLYFVAIWTFVIATDDWKEKCDKICKCGWVGGKKNADCTVRGFNNIPLHLGTEIREIDFSENRFYGLSQNVFYNAELMNIHKLKFQNCSIESIDRLAFKNLSLLIELDLSHNSIVKLDRDTFRDTNKLRVVLISFNKLKHLVDGLFYDMVQLQKIHLNNNEIETIGDHVFVKLPKLHYINLSYNRLTVINYDFTQNLNNIISLILEGNPWICDCRLQSFRNKTIKNNWITTSPKCAEPSKLKDILWSSKEIFACSPEVILPSSSPSTQIEATTTNVTLVCKVRGDPQPDVNWERTNGLIIADDPRLKTQRFVTSRLKIGNYTWNNLTIINVNYRDRGEYKCVATNPGGVDKKNLTLIVSSSAGSGGSLPLPLASSLPLVIGLSVGAIVVLLVILLTICCCCKRSTHGMNNKRRDLIQASDECINLHGQPEMEKALITDVNPVMKPPRVCSVPPSVTSGGTEVSEVKKNLLDNDSVFAGDDESRSLDFDLQPYRKSQNLLDADYRGTHPYPPDLLPFPPRMSQVSPAGSSASTVADTSRLPAHHGPQSPLYEQINQIYRTLPHSRSQSPFIGGPQTTARIPRQGYVTIPRRPRQSWSSEPPSTLSDIGEPLYDNLGLRTTADGSSVLSLNKIGEVTTPKSVRMFPMLSPTNCDPIAEQDLPPVAIATLPRNLATLSPSSRTNWAKANAEALRSPEHANRRNSVPADGGKVTKIPPLPPPKPKKRAPTGPLFEDEGEDGTEV